MADWDSSRVFYESEAWRTLSRRARERDRWTCRDCGFRATTSWERSRMHSHHRVSRPHVAHATALDVLSNLTTLCSNCHLGAHGRATGAAPGTLSTLSARRAPRAPTSRAPRPGSPHRCGSRRR